MDAKPSKVGNVLVDPVTVMAQGFATIGTDAGHDNARNSRPEAGGTAAFGLDPQARVTFAFAAYDQVTRVGKLLTLAYYGQPPRHARAAPKGVAKHC